MGTRGSLLARRQTSWVVERIRALFPELVIEELVITTRGDARTDVPLPKIGDKGAFTRELEAALLSGEIDFAVHSLKDLPTEIPEGLTLGAVPERANPLDALLARDGRISFAELAEGSVVGTSSLRRAAQLRRARPDLQISDVRGNLDTRIRKLRQGQMDALVLAAAGLDRMGWEQGNYTLLPPDVCLPAPGQGALAVEIREGDQEMREICLRTLEDPATRRAVTAERAFLEGLGGGCQVPVGAYAVIEGGCLCLQGAVISSDGSRCVRGEVKEEPERAEEAGRSLAALLMEQGAKEILADEL